jgi:hypothetical protein
MRALRGSSSSGSDTAAGGHIWLAGSVVASQLTNGFRILFQPPLQGKEIIAMDRTDIWF